MKKIMILATVAATLAACNNEEDAFVDNRDPNVIYMTAGVDAVAVTRAEVATFPNALDGSAKIAVVARYTNTALATDWNSPYINHVSANVANGSDSNFAFNWLANGTQYWPVSGEELQFLAYSPIDNSSTVTKNATANKINISLAATHTDMPDVIVANKTSQNEDITGKKENTGDQNGPGTGAQNPVTVDFQFKHILSQLDVMVKGKNSNDKAKIDKVEVIVDKAQVKKNFDMTVDLTANAEGWDTNGDAEGDLTYTYTSPGNLSTGGTTINGTTPILLFPDTQDNIKVKVWVKDDSSEAVELPTVTLSDAITVGGSGKATLQTGKKNTLTITVKGVEISGMQGGVTEWTSNGEFNADIQ